MHTQAQVDRAIAKHVRDFWRRHRMLIGGNPKILPFDNELVDLCSEATAAEPCPATLLDFIATPGTGAR